MAKQMIWGEEKSEQLSRDSSWVHESRNIITKIREIERDVFGEVAVRYRDVQQTDKQVAKVVRGKLTGKTEITRFLIHL